MRSNKPKIGITLSETIENPVYRWPARKAFDYIKQEYYQAIIRAGGFPVLLPNVESAEFIEDFIDSVDALLITGGGDINPKYFGQVPHPKLGTITKFRDNFEMNAFELAMAGDKPILGICRGHQVINVALGGTLHQDLSCINPKPLEHADTKQTATNFHDVKIDESSNFYKIIGSSSIETNSSHHQVIDKLGNDLRAVAFSIKDGIIEAIEHIDRDFIIGVQWHPEGTMDRAHSQKLFEALVKKAWSRLI